MGAATRRSATEKQCKAETSNGLETPRDDKQRNGIAKISNDMKSNGIALNGSEWQWNSSEAI